MPEQDLIQTTPLQNLFYYIRDLYNTSDPCYDFEKETSNSKTEDGNYWKVSKLISLAKQCEQKKINEFSFAVGILESYTSSLCTKPTHFPTN